MYIYVVYVDGNVVYFASTKEKAYAHLDKYAENYLYRLGYGNFSDYLENFDPQELREDPNCIYNTDIIWIEKQKLDS